MAQADRFGNKVSSHLAGAVLHSSHEPGELSQCSKHDHSTIKNILVLLLGDFDDKRFSPIAIDVTVPCSVCACVCV